MKKNIVFDITLSNGQWTADLIKACCLGGHIDRGAARAGTILR